MNGWAGGRWVTPVNDYRMHNIMTLIGSGVMVALYSSDNKNLVVVVQQFAENKNGVVWNDNYPSYAWDFVDNSGSSVPGQ